MQVSVETLSTLERRVTVQIPAEQVTGEIHSRLQKLSRHVKVHGFRPGKIPPKLIKKLYGNQVRHDVLSELMQNSLQEALMQENLNPVGNPTINPINLDEERDLEYSATFEIMPKFNLTRVENIRVERPVAEVTESDVDAMIETLRQQRVLWNAVERPAQWGDRVLVDFNGQIDGQDCPGSKGENARVVLGNGVMFKDFEDRLVGLSVGADTGFDLTFPPDHHVPDLAGKMVQFQVRIHRVEQAVLPELGDAFAQDFDISTGGMASLRQSLRDNMDRELRNAIKTTVKGQVLRGLLIANPISLPQTLIDAKIEILASQIRFPADLEHEIIQQRKIQLFESEARQRVALGLLMAQLALTQGIRADEQQVQERLEKIAASYEKPDEMVRSYQQNQPAMENLRSLVIEDQIVDWLLERARVTEKPSTFAEVIKFVSRPSSTD